MVGAVGESEHVDPLVGGGQVAEDQRAHPLGLAVEGVVVARRQGVGAEHDAALHLRTEARRTGPVVHLTGRRSVDPQSEAHAVVAGEVRRSLRRRDEVVGGQAVHRCRDCHLLHLGAGALQGLGRGSYTGHDIGRNAFGAHQLADQTDPEAVDALVELSD